MKAGKKPFFLKKSAKRRAELVAKYEELKGSGNHSESWIRSCWLPVTAASCSGKCRVWEIRPQKVLLECTAAAH